MELLTAERLVLLSAGAVLYFAGVLVALCLFLWHAVPQAAAARRCSAWSVWLLARLRARPPRSGPPSSTSQTRL